MRDRAKQSGNERSLASFNTMPEVALSNKEMSGSERAEEVHHGYFGVSC
ncbi:MAG: hypothetical protein JWM99_3778 [Verrucomicrobiales bacterium]|nr:hypothetical protein [Verrucomicrobiales bacterium]